MNVFTVHTESNDIEDVLICVAEALREWEGGRISTLDLSLIGDGEGHLLPRARALRLQWNIDSNAVVHSTRLTLGPWIIRFQTLVRRLTWWFLEPILQQVRAFQMNIARVVEGLAENQEAMLSELSSRGEEREDLVGRLAELETQVAALRAQLEEGKGRGI